MDCRCLTEKEIGKEIQLGENTDLRPIIKAIDISERCNDLDAGSSVALIYVRDKHYHLCVVVSIQSVNGEETRYWHVRSVENSHKTDGKNGKHRYANLKGFKECAKKIGLAQVVLANYILNKKPPR